MKQFLVLSKEDTDLASSEVIESLNLNKIELIDNFLIFDKEYSDKESNLAYTNKILELLFRCDKDQIENKINNFDWSSIYKTNFSLRVPQKKSLDKKYGGIIYDLLDEPKVELKNSKTPIEIYFSDKEAFVCILKQEIDNKFEERKSHKRPSPHPSSLHPKLARAMVNMLGDVEVIIDPFCGSGGLLIEGALTGHKVIGIELDEIMIKRCYNNLKHYKIDSFEIEQRDSTNIVKMDYFVADLPYGLNTKAEELTELYYKFFKDLQFKKAVVGFPDFFDYKKMLKKHNIKIKKEFDYYLHKNLKKKILILKF